ncbi:MAG: TIGR03013 family PEP-CTERM/XrtA system glycosyltransferase [Nitrospira sp.]|nr:TIGR03013 family PEP-CTERM/XrtA system glycosyltransferase [Nitrospira sp.]MCP9442460.1 TIGR03013 family PEP-CTERM/XrtA system glycosyltransferase [Nitrospira sp.]
MEKTIAPVLVKPNKEQDYASGLDLFKRRVVLLGCGQLAVELYRVLAEKRWTNLQVIGVVDQNPPQAADSFPVKDLQVLGSCEDLRGIVEEFAVNMIVVCMEDRRAGLPVHALLDLKARGIEVIDGHQMFEEVSGRLSIDQLRPSALIFSTGFKRRAPTKVLKRTVDLTVSVLGLAILAPVLCIIALLIKLDSPGPIFYRQMRVGLGGQPFMMWKFRSMYQEAERHGPRWAEKNDARVSRVGRILRKFRLDEIPQLYNVIRGEMSLVGPRPERPVFVNELRKSIPYYDIRHTVRPGLTGWAQTQFQYGASAEDAHAKLQYDLYYVKNMTFALDLRIMLETIRVVLLGEGAR